MHRPIVGHVCFAITSNWRYATPIGHLLLKLVTLRDAVQPKIMKQYNTGEQRDDANRWRYIITVQQSFGEQIMRTKHVYV